MLFTNDIVFIDKTRHGVNDKLGALETCTGSRDFRVSRSKMEYLHYCFSGRVNAGG